RRTLPTMMLFQKRQYRFGRPADGGTPARHHDGSLQQDGVRGDRPGNVGFAKIGFLLAELLELRFAITDQILRIAAHQVDQLFDLGLARRLVEILPDRRFYSLAAQELEGLPRLAAARVVPDRDGHSDAFSMPPPSYPRFRRAGGPLREFPPVSASFRPPIR